MASARTGGLAAGLCLGPAPAFAQGTTCIGQGVPELCAGLRPDDQDQINEQAQKDLGLKINLEGVEADDQARVTSSVSSGAVPDIISAHQ